MDTTENTAVKTETKTIAEPQVKLQVKLPCKVDKIEQSLRKYEHLCGTWLLLGNGEKWCIPAMSLGRSGQTLLDKLFDLQRKEEELESNPTDIKKIKEVFRAAANFARIILNQNYPELTKELFEKLDLVTVQHIPIITGICKGEKGMNEIISSPVTGGEL